MWIFSSDQPSSHWTNIIAGIVGVFGGISGVVATYYAILGAIEAF
jgi:hypothetical protein